MLYVIVMLFVICHYNVFMYVFYVCYLYMLLLCYLFDVLEPNLLLFPFKKIGNFTKNLLQPMFSKLDTSWPTKSIKT